MGGGEMKRSESSLEREFKFILLSIKNIPTPNTEYRFFDQRQWRFDFAWPERKIAVELEGGIWVAGRHSRGEGMLADMKKYNKAVTLGWRILRYGKNNMWDFVVDWNLLGTG